jgi:2-methylaconitate cis-trans-isomerase PrpF
MFSKKIWIFFLVLIAHRSNVLSTIEEMYVKKHYEKVAIKALNEFSSVKMKNEENVKKLVRMFLAQRVRQELNTISWTLRLG